MRKILFVFLLFSVFLSCQAIDKDEINGVLLKLDPHKDIYPDKYEKIKELRFLIGISETSGRDEKAQEYYRKFRETARAYLDFAEIRPEIVENGERVKLLLKYKEEADRIRLDEYYPDFYSFMKRNAEEAESLYQTGKKAEKELDFALATEKNRFNVIEHLTTSVLDVCRKYLDNGNFIYRTEEMINEVENMRDNMRERFFRAIDPQMFLKMVEEIDKIRSYQNELIVNLQSDLDYTKKDYYYTIISNKTGYIRDNLQTIIDSTQSEVVHRIWKLRDRVSGTLEKNSAFREFFPEKYEEISTLYEKTVSESPNNMNQLIIMQDELMSYNQLLEDYLLRISSLEKLKNDVKSEYEKVVENERRFEEVSYAMLNDIAQYVLAGDRSYDSRDYENSLRYYKKADERMQRQTVITQLHRFSERTDEFNRKYALEEIFPEKFGVIGSMIDEALHHSVKGDFEKAYGLVKKIKERLTALASERKKQLRILESIRNEEDKDFYIYTVEKGETLTGIALKLFGSTEYAWKIWAWNHENYKNPDRIYPGDILKIYRTEDHVEDSDG